jgi:putative tricarboxylic transport membrane protein
MLEQLINVIWVVAGSAATWHAWSLGLIGASGPESGLFPFLASALMTLLGGILLLNPRTRATGVLWPSRTGRWRVMGVLFGIAILCQGMDSAGFTLSSLVALVVLLQTIQRAPLWESVVLSLISVGVVHLVLGQWLGMPLPRGPWGW